MNVYDNSIIDCIQNFCARWLIRMQNITAAPPETITKWHGGLKLLWRAMQNERDESEADIPIASPSVQRAAKGKLTLLLKSPNGSVMYQLSPVTKKFI